MGQAKLVPCVQTVSTADDLITEAERLWSAEQPSAKSGIASTWGRVAVLCNPEREVPQGILDGWAKRVAHEAHYNGHASQFLEGDIVDRSKGLLRIDWPRLVTGGAPVQFDILLATVTDPSFGDSSSAYPSPKAIADVWNKSGRHVEYFWNNTDNGICTFEDPEIRALLRPKAEVGV